MKLSGEERYTEKPDKVSPYADTADALQYLLLGGGEGRVSSDGTGKEPAWPKDNRAITPQPTPEARQRQQSGFKVPFDPRTGSVFHER